MHTTRDILRESQDHGEIGEEADLGQVLQQMVGVFLWEYKKYNGFFWHVF